LLDLRRLDVIGRNVSCVDLVEFCRNVAADTTPLASTQGYELSLRQVSTVWPSRVMPAHYSASSSILVQNTIEHRGGKGNITIKIDRRAIIEVRTKETRHKGLET
jgi:hypothetical protein